MVKGLSRRRTSRYVTSHANNLKFKALGNRFPLCHPVFRKCCRHLYRSVGICFSTFLITFCSCSVSFSYYQLSDAAATKVATIQGGSFYSSRTFKLHYWPRQSQLNNTGVRVSVTNRGSKALDFSWNNQ